MGGLNLNKVRHKVINNKTYKLIASESNGSAI